MKDELNGDPQFCDKNSGKTRENDQDDADLHEDRFRVDRKKLEQMLLPGANGETGLAQAYFEEVMRQTDTIITWPSKLKIGAKSKKDPHVTIKGKRQDVEHAKSCLNRTFDTKSGHVSLKMDIAFDEHSFIIGKCGRGSKEVSEMTDTQIHFPDGNRNIASRKSNQVSLRGTVANVELARQRLRALMSLTFWFYVKMVCCVENGVENALIFMKDKQPQVKLNVQRFDEQLLVTVKGTWENSEAVKLCVKRIMVILIGVNSRHAVLYNTLEILAENQCFVRGVRNAHIAEIERATGASIRFPMQAPFGPTPTSQYATRSVATSLQMPSKVEISGHNVDSIYRARQKLIGFLPVTLVFDLDVNVNTNVDCPAHVKMDVRSNDQKPLNSIILKTFEKDAQSLFEIHAHLMAMRPARRVLPHKPPPITLPVPVPSPKQLPLTVTGKLDEQLARDLTSISDFMNYRASDFSRQQGSVISSTASSLTTPGHSPEPGSPIDKMTNNTANGYDIAMDASRELTSLLQRCSVGSPSQMQYRMTDLLAEKQDFNPYYSMWREADDAVHHVFKGPEIRVPNDRFATMGYSKSMPHNILQHLMDDSRRDPWSDRSCNANVLPGASNRFEGGAMLVREGLKIEDCENLSQLLHVIKLEKYLVTFQAEEVDLETFMDLKEVDLYRMGITTGPRKKMMDTIRELRLKNYPDFCLAPGAERSNRNQK